MHQRAYSEANHKLNNIGGEIDDINTDLRVAKEDLKKLAEKKKAAEAKIKTKPGTPGRKKTIKTGKSEEKNIEIEEKELKNTIKKLEEDLVKVVDEQKELSTKADDADASIKDITLKIENLKNLYDLAINDADKLKSEIGSEESNIKSSEKEDKVKEEEEEEEEKAEAKEELAEVKQKIFKTDRNPDDILRKLRLKYKDKKPNDVKFEIEKLSLLKEQLNERVLNLTANSTDKVLSHLIQDVAKHLIQVAGLVKFAKQTLGSHGLNSDEKIEQVITRTNTVAAKYAPNNRTIVLSAGLCTPGEAQFR